MSQLWGKAAVVAAAAFAIGGVVTPGLSYADVPSVQVQVCSGGPAFEASLLRGTNHEEKVIKPRLHVQVPANGCAAPFYGYWWQKKSTLYIGSFKPGDVAIRSWDLNVPNVRGAVAKMTITDNYKH